jgi:transglutaminase-like putative cysteine protease
MLTYEITHATEYEYLGTVSVSHHLARLTPRTLAYQHCARHALEVDPAPEKIARHTDYFGNETAFLIVQSAHQRLEIRATSVVSIDASARTRPAASPPWESAIDRSAMPLEAIDQTTELEAIKVSDVLREYARPSFVEARPLLDAVEALTAHIHKDFVYDQSATTVATPLLQVLQNRRGVCQDFARLEIACLRSLGIPARYVSGYLETTPPPGKPRLVGADASHAWLAVYCPGAGWIDVDPTNNVFPSDRHVTLAWGRDFSDVSPLRGVILGGGDHALKVRVDVNRVGES